MLVVAHILDIPPSFTSVMSTALQFIAVPYPAIPLADCPVIIQPLNVQLVIVLLQ